MTHKVHVALPTAARSYDILIGSGLLAALGEAIAARAGQRRCIIIADQTVAPLYETAVQDSCRAAGHQLLPSILVPAGEGSKNWQTLQNCVDGLIERKIDRKTLILALGGGVIGDLAGLAAAVTLRGLDFVQIPTTLLAMVDSAVGGKTAIDHRSGKNLIGAFHQPLLVLSDLDVLKTLSARDLRAGYAETVKYGLLGNSSFYDWCEANAAKLLNGDAATQAYAVHQACLMKAAIVARDEREADVRALLNLGHTFGHALETIDGYGQRWRHGEAVAIGITLAARLSQRQGLIPAAVCERIETHFIACALPTAAALAGAGLAASQLLELMRQDKKAEGGALTLVLLRGLGEAFVQKAADEAAVLALWQQVLA